MDIVKPFSWKSLSGVFETGTVAFVDSIKNEIPEKPEHRNCKWKIEEIKREMPELFPVGKDNRRWRCKTELYRGNQFHTYTLLHDEAKEIYFLTFQWSFG
jgi:hypothetical protein